MSEDKRDGKKKYLRKHKYKSHSKTQAMKIDPHKEALEATPILEKNWSRYDEPEDEADEEYSSNRDFKALSELPVSQGAHFQFKKDKQFLPNKKSKTPINNLFYLDINLINASLLTIPFYERLGFDKTLFTEDQIEGMDSAATAHTLKYEEFLINKHKAEADKDHTSRSPSPEKEVEEVVDKISTIDVQKDTETVELEAWLDDILD